jgi:hypothetical protein
MALTTATVNPLEWASGPARYAKGQIWMVVQPYEPKQMLSMADQVDVELSRIHAPDDAVAFVSRFGMLEKAPFYPMSIYPDPIHTAVDEQRDDEPEEYRTPDDEIPSEVSEPYADFERAAEDLRSILHVMKNVRRVLDGDDAHARTQLEAWAQRMYRRPGFDATEEQARIAELTKEPDFLRGITAVIAGQLDRRLNPRQPARPARLEIHGPTDPRELADRFTLGFSAPTLKVFVFAQLAEKLVARTPILECEECGHDFVSVYGGKRRAQRFCTRNCARRARYQSIQLEAKRA